MLKRRIRLLAALKINHLQLYFEHPFRFRFDPDIAGGPHADAYTPEILRDLDAYCRDHFIEFAPSFTCYGHLGRLLSLPQYRHLAEVEFPAPTWEDATWLQRLRGATLYTPHPQARQLIQNILDEFLPCFTAPRFNLCGDETHDLGRRTPGATPAQLAQHYTDHLHHLHRIAARHGKTLMLWGDMLHQYPDAIPRLPPRAHVLDWAYYPANNFDKCRAFTARGIPTVTCPSTRGFGRLFNAVEEARTVLIAQARAAQTHGAIGLLTTDWGDYGHFNMPPASLHAIALGAHLAWNPANDPHAPFDHAFSALLFGAPDPHPAQLYAQAGATPAPLATWPLAPVSHTPWPTDPAPARRLLDQAPAWATQFSRLTPTPWIDENDLAQLALACRFLHLAAHLATHAPPAQTLPLLDELEKAYAPLWYNESQPQGLIDLHTRGFTPLRHHLQNQ